MDAWRDPTSGRSHLDFGVKCQLCPLPPPSTHTAPRGCPFIAAAPSPRRFFNSFMCWLAIGKTLDSSELAVSSGGEGCTQKCRFLILTYCPICTDSPPCTSLGIQGPFPERNTSSLHIQTQIFVRHNKGRLKSFLTCAVRQAV